MSMKVELSIDDQEYVVRELNWQIARMTNERGQPASMPEWLITVSIDVANNTTLIDWMIDPGRKVDGKITLHFEDGSSKVISFDDAYCFHLVDHFKADEGYGTTTAMIVGHKVTVGQLTLTHDQPNEPTK
jgi:hypothetical protein